MRCDEFENTNSTNSTITTKEDYNELKDDINLFKNVSNLNLMALVPPMVPLPPMPLVPSRSPSPPAHPVNFSTFSSVIDTGCTFWIYEPTQKSYMCDRILKRVSQVPKLYISIPAVVTNACDIDTECTYIIYNENFSNRSYSDWYLCGTNYHINNGKGDGDRQGRSLINRRWDKVCGERPPPLRPFPPSISPSNITDSRDGIEDNFPPPIPQVPSLPSLSITNYGSSGDVGLNILNAVGIVTMYIFMCCVVLALLNFSCIYCRVYTENSQKNKREIIDGMEILSI
tara:strand:- start:4086 stop:4940 length:855 start_codon:yes stop_codon:yes gene_type:complete